MKKLLKKTFADENYIRCLGKIRRFIDEYTLELISINLRKKENLYVANIQYDLKG